MSVLSDFVLHRWWDHALPVLKILLAICWLAILSCALTGCGTAPRCINPGADWSIYVASRADLTAEWVARGGDHTPNRDVSDGFTDRERKEIWVVGKPSDAAVLRPFAHELLRHMIGDDEALARLYSPRFDILYRDGGAQARAAALALAEARKATHD